MDVNTEHVKMPKETSMVKFVEQKKKQAARQQMTKIAIICEKTLISASILDCTLNFCESAFSPFLTISLYRAGHYFSHTVFSYLVPCLQSAGISSCLPLCCPSISFSVGLCSFSQKPLVLVIFHRCGCVLASNHFSLLFSREVSTGSVCDSPPD